MTSVRASSAQKARRSLLETSALFPTETKLATPIWPCWRYSRIAMPSAPLSDNTLMCPGGGRARGGKGGAGARRGIRVEDPHAVRTDEPHAGTPRQVNEALLRVTAAA